MEADGSQLGNSRRKMLKQCNSNNNILSSILFRKEVNKKKMINAKQLCVRNSNKKVTFSLNDDKNTNSKGDLTQEPSLNVRKRRKRSAATSKTLTNRSVCATAKVTSVVSENNEVVKKKKTDLLTSAQTDRCFEPSKCNESFSPESIVRELEVTESTLTSVPDESDDFTEMESKPCVSDNAVTLQCLINVLEESHGALLRSQQGSYTNYLCPKCNKCFKNVKPAAHHYYSCESFKRTELIVYKDLLFICLKCLFCSPEYNELIYHKKSCSSIHATISNCIRHYRNVDKRVCGKCCFSCISIYTFNQHDCEKELRRMKKCKVDVKKLTETDWQTLDQTINLQKFECPTCEEVFYEERSFKKHSEVHSIKGVENAKSFIKEGRAYVREAKMKLIKKAKVYKDAQEMLKEFVEPFSQIELTTDPQNTDCLNRDLIDATLPYENQVLLKEVAKPIVEKEVDSVCKELGIPPLEEETDSESHLHPPDTVSPLSNFKCQCENKSAHIPEKEVKPCLKCLNKFVLSSLSTTSDEIQTSVHNSSASLINDHLNLQSMPKIAVSSEPSSNIENCTASDFNMSEVLTAVNIELDAMPSINPSTDIALLGNIVIQEDFLHNEVTADSLNIVSDITKQDQSDSAKISVNECCAGTSVEAFRQDTYSSICIANVSSQVLENIQSNDLEAVASCPNNCVSDSNSSNSQESAKDHEGTDNNMPNEFSKFFLSKIGENFPQKADSVEDVKVLLSPTTLSRPELVRSPDSVSQNVVNRAGTPDSGIVLKNPEDVNIRNYDEFLNEQMTNKSVFDVQFDVENVKVSAHTFFEKGTENSAYVFRSSRIYYCATCLDEIPVLELIQHLVDKHKDYDINICVI